MSKFAWLLLSAAALSAQRPATAEEIQRRDITIFPNGAGLPAGQGNATQGLKHLRTEMCLVTVNAVKARRGRPRFGGRSRYARNQDTEKDRRQLLGRMQRRFGIILTAPPASMASSLSTCRRRKTTELCWPAMKAGLNFIRLATPTTDENACPRCSRTRRASCTTSLSPASPAARRRIEAVGEAVARIKRHTKLPVCVGFGIRTPEAARAIAEKRQRRGGRHRAG